MTPTTAALPMLAATPHWDEALPLAPCQQSAFDQLERVIAAAPIVGLIGPTGGGKSLLLRRLALRHGGIVITVRT